MPLDKSLNFTPVETGKMTEIPPDLPAGHWEVSIKVKNNVSADGIPRIFLEYTAQADLTGEHDEFVGASCSEMIGFYPASDGQRAKMSKIRVKAICEAWPDVPEPDTESLASGDWSSLEPFVEALEANQREIWTSLAKPDKNGIVRTNIHQTEPGKKLQLAPQEPEEEEDKPSKSKTNGHTAKKSKR